MTPEEITAHLERNKPAADVELIFASIKNKENWKLPTGGFVTTDKVLAQRVASCLDWYMGGSEINLTRRGELLVTSRGYYHYIGA